MTLYVGYVGMACLGEWVGGWDSYSLEAGYNNAFLVGLVG